MVETKKFFITIDMIKGWNVRYLLSLKMKHVKMPLISYQMKIQKDCGVRFLIWKIKSLDMILKAFENSYSKGLVWNFWSQNKKVIAHSLWAIVRTLTTIIFLYYSLATKMGLKTVGYTTMWRVQLWRLVSLPLEVS